MNGLTYTHVALSLIQEGPKEERFKVAALQIKNIVSIDGIRYCGDQ